MSHVTAEQLAAWRDGSLEAEEALWVDDHAQDCPQCAARLAALYDPPAVAASLDAELARCAAPGAEAWHLDETELVARLDGVLDEDRAAEVEAHLASCDACRAIAGDLAAFAAADPARPFLERRPPRWRGATAVAAGLLAAAGLAWQLTREAPPLPSRTGAPTPPGRPAQPTPAVTEAPRELLRDGGLVLVAADPGDLAGVPEGWRDRVAAAIAAPDLRPPAFVAELAVREEVRRAPVDDGGDAVALAAPRGVVVLADRPLFRWRGPAGVTYRVEVYSQSFEAVALGPVVARPSWQPSSPLPRGEVLTWKVVAIRDGEEVSYPRAPAPPALFRVASAAAVADVEAARATGSRLLTALALWDAGLLPEAAAELAVLRAEHPEVGFVARLAASAQAAAGEAGAG